MTTRAERGGGLALTGICLGFFLVLFDATAVNVATGGIARGLGAPVITCSGCSTPIPWRSRP